MIKRIWNGFVWLLDALSLPLGIVMMGVAIMLFITGYNAPTWWGGEHYSPILDLSCGAFLIYLSTSKQ